MEISILPTVRYSFDRSPRWIAAVALCLASACVYSPESDDYVDPSATEFSGFAEHASATITIEAQRSDTGAWEVIGTTTSAAGGLYYGGNTLYPWTTTIDFDALATPSQCFWGTPGTCSIPAGFAEAHVRFSEAGSNIANLYVFDQGGVDCVVNEVNGGESWIGAGYVCRSADNPILTIRSLT